MMNLIIQARTGSTRLPNKVMKNVCGRPLLQLMIERLQHSHYATNIIIATTTKSSDDTIVALMKTLNIPVFRGSETDVLDRYYQAAKKYEADIIVRLTSDCPLIDPKITDKVIKYYLDGKNKFDFVSNMHPPTFPDGLDTEIFSFHTLEKAWKEAKKPYEREHVTPYMWDNPDIFYVGNVRNDQELHFIERWTLDYEEDFYFIKAVYEHLYREGEFFYMEDILQLLSENPQIKQINKKHLGVNWWSEHLDEIKMKEGMEE